MPSRPAPASIPPFYVVAVEPAAALSTDACLITSQENREVRQRMIQEKEAKGDVEQEQQPPFVDEAEEDIIINHKSWMIHKPKDDDPRNTKCPYVRNAELPHYEFAKEVPSNFKLYMRCTTV